MVGLSGGNQFPLGLSKQLPCQRTTLLEWGRSKDFVWAHHPDNIKYHHHASSLYYRMHTGMYVPRVSSYNHHLELVKLVCILPAPERGCRMCIILRKYYAPT